MINKADLGLPPESCAGTSRYIVANEMVIYSITSKTYQFVLYELWDPSNVHVIATTRPGQKCLHFACI